jgi:serine protease SohB
MLTDLIQLVIFIIETIVIVAAVLIIVSGVVGALSKNKDKAKSKLKIKSLNKHFDASKKHLNQTLLSKKAFKKLKKNNKQGKKKQKSESKHNIFVLDFHGDIKASPSEQLREEITAILSTATKNDEIVVRLESAGGLVHAYGFAASQLQRIKDKGIPLTICVDKIAASGGYMMACVADKILAAPFSIIGSIGVIAQIPNIHRLLKDKKVDFEQVTAGQYKRTLTVLGENTKEDRAKMKEELEDIHVLFKDFITEHRPQIDIDKVATGEHWLGTRAFDLKLIDKLQTSDDYLLQLSETHQLYEIHQHKKQSLASKLGKAAQLSIEDTLNNVLHQRY